MLVKEIMTANPVTIDKSSNIADALELMRTNKFRRLPVLDKGTLVGIVTDGDLVEVSPSPASSLSVFELNYLLAKTKIEDIFKKNKKLITIEADALVEEAALLMRDNKIGGVPVVENGGLVGIITETNIFDAFIDIMGLRNIGTRITLELPEDKPGLIADISGVIKQNDGNITHFTTYDTHRNTFRIIIRINQGDLDKITSELKDKKFNIISVQTNN